MYNPEKEKSQLERRLFVLVYNQKLLEQGRSQVVCFSYLSVLTAAAQKEQLNKLLKMITMH